MHYVQQSEVNTLGPLMASNLDSTNQGNLMQLILAGDNSLVHTLYLPSLGGVDHSTVAVIGTSGLVNGTRPQMAYFGATDGMLHAVCASTGGACDLPGRELWAYLPRTSLSTVRYNTARIDGSPRVLDAYGDFHNTGEKSWRTILMFQTGWGDTSSLDRVPAVYALDVSDPTNPTVLWEYSLANPASRGTYELGEGVTIGAGQVNVSGTFHWVGYMQTNNAGTGGSGNVVTAVDMATGSPRCGNRAISLRRRCAAAARASRRRPESPAARWASTRPTAGSSPTSSSARCTATCGMSARRQA